MIHRLLLTTVFIVSMVVVYFHISTQLVHITHDDPADGLISKPSQNGIYGLTDTYEAKGAGHLEQGNHVEVRRRLNDVFARIQNPEYFTPERQ